MRLALQPAQARDVHGFRAAQPGALRATIEPAGNRW